MYARASDIEELDLTSRSISWTLSRFRACRCTDVTAKKFDSARFRRCSSGGHCSCLNPATFPYEILD